MQLIEEVRQTGVIENGSFNVDFGLSLGVIIKQIIVNLQNANTIFDVSIIDSKDDIVYERLDEEGCLNELIDLPAKNNYTLKIENATADDTVVVKIIYHEN
jgi:hypothetical protein